MTTRSVRRLTAGRDLSVAVAVIAAAVLAVSALMAVAAPVASAENAGALTLATPSAGAGGGSTEPVTEGGSALPLALTLPAGAACTGDSAGGGYRVQTFMVPATVDPASLKFGSTGPVKPDGAEGLWGALYTSTGGEPVVDFLTSIASTPGGPGGVSGLPLVNFSVYSPGGFPLPAGEYNVGIACTLGNQTAEDQLDKFWAVRMTFVEDGGDPAGVTWTSSAFEDPTTTTTNPDGSSTTTEPGSSTTTTPGSTTSTSSGSTTTAAGGGGGAGSGSGSGSGGSALPATGVSSWVLAGWAFVLLVAGRMAWLFSRRIRVVDHSA